MFSCTPSYKPSVIMWNPRKTPNTFNGMSVLREQGSASEAASLWAERTIRNTLFKVELKVEAAQVRWPSLRFSAVWPWQPSCRPTVRRRSDISGGTAQGCLDFCSGKMTIRDLGLCFCVLGDKLIANYMLKTTSKL